MSIYQEIILEHYRHPKNYGEIKNPTKKIKLTNPLCGDRIEMMIKLVDNIIVEIKFQGQGCAISQAASSLLTDYAKGKSKEKLKKLDREFMIKLLGIDLGPNRIKCALLPLEALKKLLI